MLCAIVNNWGNYSSFFLSKKVFRCHSCKPATDKQMPSERNPSQAILEFVRLFRSCISSSLDDMATIRIKKNTLPILFSVLPVIVDTMYYILPFTEIEHFFMYIFYGFLQLLQLQFHHLQHTSNITCMNWGTSYKKQHAKKHYYVHI